MNIIDILRNLHWVPHVGDPTLMGWITVAAYLIAAWMSGLCALWAGRVASTKRLIHRLVWGCLSAGLLFLGINKQLDLQTLFTQIGRAMAYQEGWYGVHHRIQILFIFLLGAVSLALFIALAWLLRRDWRRYWLLLIGMIFLARFILVRAASFYNVPLPRLSQWTGGFKINSLLELLGTALICISAWSMLKSIQKDKSLANETA